MEDNMSTSLAPVTKEPVEISGSPIKRKRKKVTESAVQAVADILKNEVDTQEADSPRQQAINRRIAEWNKRKEKDKKQIRVRFRDYFTPNLLRTIQWQAYNDWPVRMWKVKDGDIITMDMGSIRGLTAAGKKKVIEPFNDQGFGMARANELMQTKYIEKTVQLYGFESLEFDAEMDVLPTPEILRPRSEVIFAQ